MSNRAVADTFGSGDNTFQIEFVDIGNPGNVADTTGIPNSVGSVDYAYRIGKFEISEDMVNKANTLGGLGIFLINWPNDNLPAQSTSWFDSAKFVNWLNTSTGGTPAYKFDTSGTFRVWTPSDAGYNPSNLFRNSLAKYFLPSVHEWYKAAYYDPTAGVYYDYPTGSDSEPTPVASGTAADTAVYLQDRGAGPAEVNQAGGLSPYGTMGQGGNVWEWEETEEDLLNDNMPHGAFRGARGGSWPNESNVLLPSFRLTGSPSASPGGFRVASISEPSLAGDMDCDGDVDFDDINDFALALNNPVEYESTFGVPPELKGDIDGDGDNDFDDINDFVAILNAPLTAVPEPSTILLTAVGLMGLLGCSWRCQTREYPL